MALIIIFISAIFFGLIVKLWVLSIEEGAEELAEIDKRITEDANDQGN